MSNQTVPAQPALEQTTSGSSRCSQRRDSQPSIHSREGHRRSASIPVSVFASSKKFFRSRSRSPAPPTQLHSRAASSGSTAADRDGRSPSRSRAFSGEHSRTASPAPMSPRSPLSPPGSPYSPRAELAKRGTSSSRRSSGSVDDYRRFNGTINHYGRHTNDWLFGGFSVRDTIGRLLHHEGKEG